MAQQPSSSSSPILNPTATTTTKNQQQSSQQQQPVVTESKPSQPTKKIPPLPWTHLETVNLIEVYQEKWYSLKRGQLKASQWDQVAITIASRCGFEQPSKTSTQCRHKMEKLRKRYRSEKQRVSSSWAYFVLMDYMEKGPFPLSIRPISSIHPNRRNLDPPPPPPPPPIVDDEEDDDDDDDDDEEDDDDGGGDDNVPDSSNKSRSINHILRRPPIVNRIVEKPAAAAAAQTLSFAPRQCSRVDDSDSRNHQHDYISKRKFPFQIEKEVEVEEEGNDEEEGGGGGGGGRGGGGEPLMELASVIRSFGEGFVKIEQMKMEMMKETERYRMEMETKRTEMILESQHRIVDAIAKVFCSQKKAKKMQEM